MCSSFWWLPVLWHSTFLWLFFWQKFVQTLFEWLWKNFHSFCLLIAWNLKIICNHSIIFHKSELPKSAATQAGERNTFGRWCDLADVARPSGVVRDTIGRLFLNLCTVFFTVFHFIPGLSSKTHCFNVAMLGASSLRFINASTFFCNRFVKMVFSGPGIYN